MKRGFWLGLFYFLIISIMLFSTACRPQEPSQETEEPIPTTVTPSPTPTKTPTPTPTVIAGGGTPATALPEGKGFAFEFTNDVSSGLASLHAYASTCSGILGPWNGTFDVELNYGDINIAGMGTFTFTLDENLYAEGKAPFKGSGTGGESCVITDVTDPLSYEITFSPDGSTAQIVMGSKGAGSLTVVCPDSDPITIPFAIAWGPYPLEVPVTAYEDCP